MCAGCLSRIHTPTETVGTHSFVIRSELDESGHFQQFVDVKEHLSWIKRMLGADGTGSPQEENAGVLRRMAADGDELENTRDIEFNHLFSREESAVEFIQAARGLGYLRCEHEFWKDRVSWLTAIRIRMVPTLDEITRIEFELSELAKSFDGKPDGWGCMEVIKSQTA